jgi:hypothetical protein
VGIEPTVPLPGQQFSRLPDSATLAPLRLVELAPGQGRVGADLSSLQTAPGELTAGSVIFQSLFFSLEESVRWAIQWGWVYQAAGKTIVARWKFTGRHVWGKPGLSGYLVCPVNLVRLIQLHKPDRPNRPNEQDRLADFFSILL